MTASILVGLGAFLSAIVTIYLIYRKGVTDERTNEENATLKEVARINSQEKVDALHFDTELAERRAAIRDILRKNVPPSPGGPPGTPLS